MIAWHLGLAITVFLIGCMLIACAIEALNAPWYVSTCGAIASGYWLSEGVFKFYLYLVGA